MAVQKRMAILDKVYGQQESPFGNFIKVLKQKNLTLFWRTLAILPTAKREARDSRTG